MVTVRQGALARWGAVDGRDWDRAEVARASRSERGGLFPSSSLFPRASPFPLSPEGRLRAVTP